MSTEKQTRKQIIDQRLLIAGWNVSDRSQVTEEFTIVLDKNALHDDGIQNAGNQFSDYVLPGKDGKPLAVVEAKKTSRDAEIGREQAKQYCYNIKKVHGIELPFCFYTNGHDIFF